MPYTSRLETIFCNIAIDVEVLQDFPIPLQCAEIHQLRAAGIGHVGYVDSAIRSTSEVPDQKRYRCCRTQVARFGLRPRARDIFENPANLKAAEIGDQRQNRYGHDKGPVRHGQRLATAGSNARVLPDNRVVNGLPSFPVPHHSGLALVGNSHRRQILRLEPASFHGSLDYPLFP